MPRFSCLSLCLTSLSLAVLSSCGKDKSHNNNSGGGPQGTGPQVD